MDNYKIKRHVGDLPTSWIRQLEGRRCIFISTPALFRPAALLKVPAEIQ